jgi:hypothetical protein
MNLLLLLLAICNFNKAGFPLLSYPFTSPPTASVRQPLLRTWSLFAPLLLKFQNTISRLAFLLFRHHRSRPITADRVGRYNSIG